ncbi:putative fatty acyl-CoA reductase CG5065 isoform X1 [Episyrphus balteatus]|uniref:putative fatty acyl-CoA reductase CG5065 isoform X1 n=1 Tax=Episyrphus balteatus TaxID=286459 RepID=UPI002485EABE|nr:putative fatty acyl-CoA reductase CG5065 isoform X1 [Episyrphus balteatus]
MAQLTPVQEYYKGKTVFITGASGFMGKVLLEKLLYSCSELKEVIIMMRPKRGKVPESRLDEMFKIPIFQRIKEEKPEVLKKVTLVQGDVTFDTLGLNGDNLKLITNNTNIVFHMAATLKLEGNLKDAIDMNTTGTKRVLDIAKNMPNLEALIHVSTAFCNCDQEVMYEKVYEFPHKPEDLIRLAEWMDVKMLDNITPELLKPHPNTYTYSKRLAEILVRDHYPTLPVIIARPSIVTPAHMEPLPGWVDNLNGPTGVMIGAGKGVIRSMICNGELKSEIIPVDIAVNGLIVLPYHNSQLAKKPDRVPVFNITCSDNKKKTWKWIMDVGKQFAFDYPFEIGLWYPDGNMTTNKLYHWFCVIFFMWLPAYVIDFLLFIFRQKRFMVRVQTKIATGLELLQFFTTRAWDFKSDNFMRAFYGLNEKDREIFKMNTDDLDELEYMKHSFLGGRQYVMKEPPSSLPRSRSQLKFLYVLDRACKIIILGTLLYWVYLKLGLNTMNTPLSDAVTMQNIKP